MVACRWSRACSSNGPACGSVEMSSRIGECIGAFLVQVSVPTNYWKQPTPLSTKKKEELIMWALRRLSPVYRLVFLCDPDIAKQAAPFGSLDGTLPERSGKTFLADLSQSMEAGCEGKGGGAKGWFTRHVRSKIERTDVQAIVTAENAIAHPRGKLGWDGLSASAKFDRQVGDTEPGIDDIGFDDGAGRTSLNTECTASAQICGRFILLSDPGSSESPRAGARSQIRSIRDWNVSRSSRGRPAVPRPFP